MSDEIFLKLYAVQNQDGKYFHAVGYSGSGETWVDSLSQAKIYPKIGQARSRVTFFANNYPGYGIAQIIELHVTKFNILQETDRVKKSQDKKAKQEAAYQKYLAKRELEDAQKKLTEAQATINKYKK